MRELVLTRHNELVDPVLKVDSRGPSQQRADPANVSVAVADVPLPELVLHLRLALETQARRKQARQLEHRQRAAGPNVQDLPVGVIVVHRHDQR